MRGPEVGADAKAWGRGIDRGAGALAQAEAKSRSTRQARKRMGRSSIRARTWRVLAGPPAWRSEPFVKEQIQAIHTPQDWARVARVLDRRYGSEADKARIALRTAGA
jgi:hypothetical protein